MLGYIILASIFGGVASLAGGCIVLLKRSWPDRAMVVSISFAAGVLLAVAFGDLLPEAVEVGAEFGTDEHAILSWALLAIVGFFLFERSFFWYHHHHGPHAGQPDPTLSKIWIGDTLHNFLDGGVIAASFLVSIPLGIVTTLAVAAHEIPQEIADFSLYLSKGIRRSRVVWLNVVSSLASLLGAVIAYYFWDILSEWQGQLLAFTGGMFAYIACSDLIPELHEKHHKSLAWLQAVLFLLGVGIMICLQLLLAE